MSRDSRRLAGILLVVMPSVIFGGVSLLTLIAGNYPYYMDNRVRQDLFRAGHAHAGIMLIISLVVLRYVDEAALSGGWKWFVRLAAPMAAILLPSGFFFSIIAPSATRPNAFISLAYAGAVILSVGLVALGIGLCRERKD
jgi:uncharacterized membrane protein